ncbi:MAG TPA: cytochrome C biogenesis protein [Clostridium sp.]|uniref:Cytochrome C biogenesis protein n=1 Tax=Clostridium lapidicellarium TaxID=3240931 RepID=A0ABV4DV46_9CLOT|nr:cytochrome C biogenesis protein [uncultured Clostridium sp.]NLU07151.1 cytochrome C biogenesis protein [Clostridiales bacterium]HBC95644.1 cytochrome C biogenesis protein [Clostridium sp.]
MNYKVFKIETFIPENYVDRLRERLNSIGALSIGGNYDNCMSVSKVMGCWRPLKGAKPFLGNVGEVSREMECKMEFCCKGGIVKRAVETIKDVHPYEEPVINIIPLSNFTSM